MAVDIANIGAEGRSACMMAAKVFQNAENIVKMVVGNRVFVGSASWLAVIVALLGRGGIANLPDNLTINTGRFKSI